MMAAEHVTPGLIGRLPKVRGRLTSDAPLAPLSWFRVGGPAEVLFEPADVDDLRAMVRGLPADVPMTVIGLASNLLIRDDGVPGVTVRLGKALAEIDIVGTRLHVGAGAADVSVARAARDAGIAGLEFMVGIPGAVGGALRMNAGAYGREIADILVTARAIDEHGALQDLDHAMMGFGYRRSMVPEGWIFVGATFEGTADEIDAIAARMTDIQATREASQPVKTRTGGSTFANPPGEKAWQLIERAGCRGLRRGAAEVSEHHCNFIVNTGNATAADIEGLGNEIIHRVAETTGVTLHWEIRRIGIAGKPDLREVSS